MNTLTRIQAVINTLNTISVSGEQNLDRLLGCIQVLNGLKNELTNHTEETEREAEK